MDAHPVRLGLAALGATMALLAGCGAAGGGYYAGGCPCDTTYGCDSCYCEPPSECS